MNSKKIMRYLIIALVMIVLLKIMVAMSWKFILFSVMGATLWLLLDQWIKPTLKKRFSIENLTFNLIKNKK
jgi:ABC-type bacteriocin/lantibiotic exporter with double-glycine peptidase domain